MSSKICPISQKNALLLKSMPYFSKKTGCLSYLREGGVRERGSDGGVEVTGTVYQITRVPQQTPRTR